MTDESNFDRRSNAGGFSLTKLFRLRWAPAVALALASIAFAFLAMELAPRPPTKSAVAHDRPARLAATAAATTIKGDPRSDGVARATPPDVAREPVPSASGSAPLDAPGTAPNVESFFPPPPMPLPPPIEEEPAPAPQSP